MKRTKILLGTVLACLLAIGFVAIGDVISIASSNTAPVAVCLEEVIVYLDLDGLAEIDVFAVDDGSYDPDDGDEITLSIDVDEFDCDDLDVPVPVTLTVSDGEVEDRCEAIVTVVDNTLPAIVTDAELMVVNPGQRKSKGNSQSAGVGRRKVICATFSDNCGIEIECTIDGVKVRCGENVFVKITKAPGATGTGVNDLRRWYRHIVGPTGQLVCTATDTSGNSTSSISEGGVPPF